MDQQVITKSKVFQIEGVASNRDSLKKLIKQNPQWALTPEQMEPGRKIFQLLFTTSPVQLKKNKENGTLDIWISDMPLGHIHPEQMPLAKQILMSRQIANVVCHIQGGSCKVCNAQGKLLTGKLPLSATLEIFYLEEVSPEEAAQAAAQAKTAAQMQPMKGTAREIPAKKATAPGAKSQKSGNRKKKRKSLLRQWWFWVLALVLILAVLALGLLLFFGQSRMNAQKEPVLPSTEAVLEAPAVQETEGTVPVQIPEEETQAEATTPVFEPSTAEACTLGVYQVQILGYTRTQDEEGRPTLVVSYRFINNAADNASPSMKVLCAAYQNGVQLDSARISDPAIHDESAAAQEAAPGESTDFTGAYLLTSDTTPVEVEVGELLLFGEQAVGEVYYLSEETESESPTAPAGEHTQTVGSYDITVVSWEIVKDYEGKDAIVFELGFTNNSAYSLSYIEALSFQPKQNGELLETAIPETESDTADNAARKIRPGCGIGVSFAYLLKDDTSDVTVDIMDYWTLENTALDFAAELN